MKRHALPLLALLAGLCVGCTQLGMFEDVGTDPHPPTMELVGVAYQPASSTDSTGATVTEAPKLQSPEGFELEPTNEGKNTMLIRVQFTDFGGDVQYFMVRDRDSALSMKAIPAAPKVDINGDGVADDLPAPDFFTGTSGVVDLDEITFSSTQLGPHRIEVWAEDSHGSRSEKSTFTIQLLP